MKQSAVFLMFAAVAVSEMLTKDDAEKLMRSCMDQWKPSKDDRELLTVHHTIPKTQEGKCYFGCICKGWGMIDDDGAYSQANTDAFDTLMASLAPPEIKENVEKELAQAKIVNAKCAGIVQPNKDPCVTGPEIFKCFVDEGKQLYLRAQG